MEEKQAEIKDVDATKRKLTINSSVTTLAELAADSSDNDNNYAHRQHSKNNKNGWNMLAFPKARDIKGFDDTASVFSDVTRYTGKISSVGGLEYRLNDALVVMIGVGDYDGMPNLDGVIKDYENVVKTFCTYWRYNVLFQLSDNKLVYTNDIDEIKLNENKQYKLKWNGDEIEEFVKLTRKYLVKNKHNGLMFVISSHGDRDKIMYDSDCENYELDSIFAMYQPNASQLIKSYSETVQESNYLSQIPKIFVLDMCRGSMSAKPLTIETRGCK